MEVDGCRVLQISSTTEVPWGFGLRKANRDQNKEKTHCLQKAPVAGKKIKYLGKFERPIWQGLKWRGRVPSYETGEVRKGVEHQFKHQRRISDQRQDGGVEVEGPELTSSHKKNTVTTNG